jgi:hypothetical protein
MRPTLRTAVMLLVAFLLAVSAMATSTAGCGGIAGVYEECNDSEECGYPDTVFECLDTPDGWICTRNCSFEGAAEHGQCVEDEYGVCQHPDTGDGCCFIQYAGSGHSDGVCVPGTGVTPGPSCDNPGAKFKASCTTDAECGPVLTCMKPCPSCDESCNLPCGTGDEGDALCASYGAGTCPAKTCTECYPVCDQAPTSCGP